MESHLISSPCKYTKQHKLEVQQLECSTVLNRALPGKNTVQLTAITDRHFMFSNSPFLKFSSGSQQLFCRLDPAFPSIEATRSASAANRSTTMAPRNNRAKVFAELDEQPVKDYDIEGEISQDDGGSDSDSQESVDENAGTEHYVSVGCVGLGFVAMCKEMQF